MSILLLLLSFSLYKQENKTAGNVFRITPEIKLMILRIILSDVGAAKSHLNAMVREICKISYYQLSGWPSGLRRQTQGSIFLAVQHSQCGYRAFWSTNVGVGSNPTSDKLFFLIRLQNSCISISLRPIKYAIPLLFGYPNAILYEVC